MRLRWALVLLSACYRPTGVPADAAEDSPDVPVDTLPENFLDFCPPSYSLIAGGKYRMVSAPTATWVVAHELCKQDKLEATAPFIHTHLAVLTTAAEQTNVGDLETVATWIGYTDQRLEGAWEHITAEPAAYPGNGPGEFATDPWNTGEPNGGTSESCGFLINTVNGRKLDDRPCDSAGSTLAYVCECDANPPAL